MRLFIASLSLVFLTQSVLANIRQDTEALKKGADVVKEDADAIVQRPPRALSNTNRQVPGPSAPPNSTDSHNSTIPRSVQDVGGLKDHKATAVHLQPEHKNDPSAGTTLTVHPDRVKEVRWSNVPAA